MSDVEEKKPTQDEEESSSEDSSTSSDGSSSSSSAGSDSNVNNSTSSYSSDVHNVEGEENDKKKLKNKPGSFGNDGEPEYRPTKVRRGSSSSDTSEGADDIEDKIEDSDEEEPAANKTAESLEDKVEDDKMDQAEKTVPEEPEKKEALPAKIPEQVKEEEKVEVSAPNAATSKKKVEIREPEEVTQRQFRQKSSSSEASGSDSESESKSKSDSDTDSSSSDSDFEADKAPDSLENIKEESSEELSKEEDAKPLPNLKEEKLEVDPEKVQGKEVAAQGVIEDKPRVMVDSSDSVIDDTNGPTVAPVSIDMNANSEETVAEVHEFPHPPPEGDIQTNKVFGDIEVIPPSPPMTSSSESEPEAIDSPKVGEGKPEDFSNPSPDSSSNSIIKETTIKESNNQGEDLDVTVKAEPAIIDSDESDEESREKKEIASGSSSEASVKEVKAITSSSEEESEDEISEDSISEESDPEIIKTNLKDTQPRSTLDGEKVTNEDKIILSQGESQSRKTESNISVQSSDSKQITEVPEPSATTAQTLKSQILPKEDPLSSQQPIPEQNQAIQQPFKPLQDPVKSSPAKQEQQVKPPPSKQEPVKPPPPKQEEQPTKPPPPKQEQPMKPPPPKQEQPVKPPPPKQQPTKQQQPAKPEQKQSSGFSAFWPFKQETPKQPSPTPSRKDPVPSKTGLQQPSKPAQQPPTKKEGPTQALPNQVKPSVTKTQPTPAAKGVVSNDSHAKSTTVPKLPLGSTTATPAAKREENSKPTLSPRPTVRSSYVSQASNRISSSSLPNPEQSKTDRRLSPSPTSADRAKLTKMYTQAVQNTQNNVRHDTSPVFERKNMVKDITQMYVETIAKNTPPASPRVGVRAKPSKDITQLYTGKFETKESVSAEKLSPRKHNMSTAVDKDGVREAYEEVRSDTSDTEWAVFKFDGNRLGVTAKGQDFETFKQNFGNADRGFGYIRITTGDELSKRAKFVLVTWVGPSVSVMKKAKMSTDKALMKEIIQNLSVELQLENHNEFSHDQFKYEVDKAAGAFYGTGVRDL